VLRPVKSGWLLRIIHCLSIALCCRISSKLRANASQKEKDAKVARDKVLQTILNLSTGLVYTRYNYQRDSVSVVLSFSKSYVRNTSC
jgi:hypothetical protein